MCSGEGERPATGDELAVSFFGVRGSTPCCSPSVGRYGGNTSSVVVEAPGCAPLLLDLGTGVREYGRQVVPGRPFRCRALVSHLHWDHVQGLPFFGPALSAGGRVEVYAPPPGSGLTLEQALDSCIHPPFFPVTLRELAGEVVLREVTHGERLQFDDITVTAHSVPHVGPTLGYRLEWRGVRIAYVPDHQQPFAGATTVDESVLQLADGVDLLIHDAQYTAAEFAEKSTWGHSTTDYAVEVAEQAGVHTLALFHHDPLHDDAMVDELLCRARARAGRRPEVIAAAEGMRLTWPGRLR
jgi:ribonuclease BN (tRNA processing enzyme)